MSIRSTANEWIGFIEKLCFHVLDSSKAFTNKNDKIHKNEVQQIRWSDEYGQ